jgi:hypothetical protein
MHTRQELLTFALGLEQHYRGQGFSLTLRQMYYQLVARGHLENGQKHYKRIGDVLTKARYEGEFPLNGMVDRGRSIQGGSSTRCDDSIQTGAGDATNWIRNLPEFLLQTHRWYAQETYVSVWVEKEALAEIFEQTCNQLGVGWFACRGYPSVSSLYSFLKTAERATEGERHPRYSFGDSSWEERHHGTAEKVVVLYFGDHDPDGWEIPRSCERNLNILQQRTGTEMEIEFKRIALNMDQIEEFDPPPFPAKITSSRYEKYNEEHDTNDAWELDALEPPVLQQLITENVEAYFDEAIFDQQQEAMGARQDTLRDQMSDPDFYEGIF